MKNEVEFIFQSHKESPEFVGKMLSQVDAIELADKEVIIVASATEKEFERDYKKEININKYNFPIKIIGSINSCGEARNIGAKQARYENLIFADMHVCFTSDAVQRLLKTLDKHPNAAVGPTIAPGEFPTCACEPLVGDSFADFPGCKDPRISVAGGMAYRFVDQPFEWVWLPVESKTEYRTPMCCGCAYSMKKDLFDRLEEYGGFLYSQVGGLGAEEAFGARLARVADGVFIEPRATFLHLFKGYKGHPKWDEHMVGGFYESRVLAIYLDVFNEELCKKITELCEREWGDEWTKNLKLAQKRFRWLREKLRPFKDEIKEENYYIIE